MPKRIDELLADYLEEVSEANRKREARKLRDRLIEASESAWRDSTPNPSGTNPQKASAILQKNREFDFDGNKDPKRIRRPKTEPWSDRPKDIVPFAFDEETVKENRRLQKEWVKENEDIAKRNEKRRRNDKGREFNRNLDKELEVKRDSARARRLADLKRQKKIKFKQWEKVVDAAKKINEGKEIKLPEKLLDELEDTAGEVGGPRRGPMFWLGILSSVSDIISGEPIQYEDIPILNEAEPVNIGGEFEDERAAVEDPWKVRSLADLRRLSREALKDQ